MTALFLAERAIELPDPLIKWLDESAEGIDLGEIPAAEVLPRLGEAGLTRIGLAEQWGGTGLNPITAVQAVSAVAERSLTAAFILWGQRSYAEFLTRAESGALRDRQLPLITAGERAGASALSNVMKFLAGFEKLQVTARREGSDIIINGKLPWVTNLRREGFWVAVAAQPVEGGPPMIVSLGHDDSGLVRSEDLSLLGMRSSDTAALTLTEVRIPGAHVIAENAENWLPTVRPVFIALQCAMTIGVARRSLAEARKRSGAGRDILGPSIDATAQQLAQAEAQIFAGIGNGSFAANIVPLFELRIQLSELAQAAVSLELQVGGGRNFLRDAGRDFARRWREAAFIPLITPSIVQLQTTLAESRKVA